MQSDLQPEMCVSSLAAGYGLTDTDLRDSTDWNFVFGFFFVVLHICLGRREPQLEGKNGTATFVLRTPHKPTLFVRKHFPLCQYYTEE